MALQVFKLGGKIRLVEDSADIGFIPFRSFDFEPTTTEVLILNTEKGSSSIKRVLISDIQNQAGSAVGNREAVITYLSEFVGGFSNAGGSAIPTSDIFHGGFVDYNDLGTTATPITFTAVGHVVLTNDKAGAFTNEVYLPDGITSIFSNNKFDFSELKLGDMIDIRIDISVNTDSPNQEVKVDLALAVGTAGEYLIPFEDIFEKSAGFHPINRFNGVYMGDLNTLNNPGEFRLSSDSSGNVVVNGWYCKIIRKG